ncbi:type II toxin-antitoxin system RelE/ParE family toxin [Agathobaculum desmolans]|uniref:type II toxin-antitoxin system RelE/ParE family toxin n=1 Tax=Agathobaculum desmolans TaxID=39484 RepID=UPI0004E15ED5|nr:type II toxin-antitoxin system RelE/ParE family toxin [Agathobaculum desmolans]
MKVLFKKTALDDMQATERYISETLGNGVAAKKLTRRVFDAIMLLEENPYMGTELCRKFAVETDLRFLVVAKQLVFYRVVEDDHIEVTRVLDGRQDYLALLF